MKLDDLKPLNESASDAERWILDHWDTNWADFPHALSVSTDKDGKIVLGSGSDVFIDLMAGGSKYNDDGTLPYEFAETGGSFTLRNAKSLKGCPKKVRGYFHLFLCNDLTSFEGAPEEIGKSSMTNNENIFQCTSLHGIHEHIKTLYGHVALGGDCKKAILGLLKIKGIASVVDRSFHKRNLELKKAASIINGWIAEGGANVIKAQRELLDADLDDYAEL